MNFLHKFYNRFGKVGCIILYFIKKIQHKPSSLLLTAAKSLRMLYSAARYGLFYSEAGSEHNAELVAAEPQKAGR